jgi:type I restriction enzyme S subunit
MDWLKVHLSNIATINMGQSPPSNSYNDTGKGLPLFQGKAEFGSIHPTPIKWCTEPTKIAQKNDILMSVRTPVGPTNIADQICCIGRGLAAIRAKKDIAEQKYLYWLFKFIERSISDLGQGSTFKAINRSNIESISIPLPTLSEQHRIVEILDQADALRRKRLKADQISDRILPNLFIKMFGDPVANPMGWDDQPLKYLGKITTGNTPSRAKPEYYGNDIEWIKSDNINTPYHFLTIAQEGLSKKGKNVGRVVPANSTLVTCIAGSLSCIGNAALADREVAFNQQINAITPNEDINPYFLYTQILLLKKIIQSLSTNAMKGMVSKKVFQELKCIVPPQELQNKFGEQFTEYLSYFNNNMVSKSKLELIFSVLLNRAFSGELTAKWREAHLKELLQEMEHQAKLLNNN